MVEGGGHIDPIGTRQHHHLRGEIDGSGHKDRRLPFQDRGPRRQGPGAGDHHRMRLAFRLTDAHGETGIVGEHGPGAHQHGIGPAPQPMGVGPGLR